MEGGEISALYCGQFVLIGAHKGMGNPSVVLPAQLVERGGAGVSRGDVIVELRKDLVALLDACR